MLFAPDRIDIDYPVSAVPGYDLHGEFLRNKSKNLTKSTNDHTKLTEKNYQLTHISHRSLIFHNCLLELHRKAHGAPGSCLPQAVEVELTVYNIVGQPVRTLVAEHQRAGWYAVEWDATGLAAGLYFYRLQAGAFGQVKKMLLIK